MIDVWREVVVAAALDNGGELKVARDVYEDMLIEQYIICWSYGDDHLVIKVQTREEWWNESSS